MCTCDICVLGGHTHHSIRVTITRQTWVSLLTFYLAFKLFAWVRFLAVCCCESQASWPMGFQGLTLLWECWGPSHVLPCPALHSFWGSKLSFHVCAASTSFTKQTISQFQYDIFKSHTTVQEFIDMNFLHGEEDFDPLSIDSQNELCCWDRVGQPHSGILPNYLKDQ